MDALNHSMLSIRAFGRENRTELLFVVLILHACVYAALNRTLEDFIHYPAILAVITTAGIHYYLVSFWISTGARVKLERSLLWGWFVYIPIIAVACGIAYYSAWVVIKDAYLWLQAFVPSRPFAYAITIPVVLLIGYALFQFRLRCRFFYGLGEATVGVLVAVMRVPVSGGDPFDWESAVYIAMLTAGVFLVVRGFDNMHTGLRPDSYDAFLKAINENEAWMRRIRASRTLSADEKAPPEQG